MDGTWYTDVTSQEVDEKVIESGDHRAHFCLNAYKYGFLGPFDKNCLQPKTGQKGEIFSVIDVVLHRIWLKCIVYPLTYQKNAF